jgi:mRNA-degrading endonuclease toxin of MazEF toxin-antitoxin module
VRRGEVRWGEPPIPGAARKRRPFLVVSDDAFNANDRYAKILVVHLTPARRAGGPYEWEVEVLRGVAGLPQSSLVKCNEVYTLFKTQLGPLLGTLPRQHLQAVDRALCVALSLRHPGGGAGI